MRRRAFSTFLGGAAAATTAWSSVLSAQQKAIPVIAFLNSGAADAGASKALMTLTEAGLREIGLVQGRDYVFETAWANSDSSRFPALAAQLLARNPAAVVVSTILAVKAVQALSRTVPIVMTGMNDPVAAGLVASLARPGGNITGVSTMAEDVLLKLIGLMREALPDVRSLTVMTNPTNPSNPPMVDMLKRHVASQGLSIATIGVGAPADLDAAFAEMARQRPGALFVLTDNSLQALAEPINTRALAQRVPAFANLGDTFARAGGLFDYSRDPEEAFQSVARLLKKILGGAATADLAIEQPTTFKLYVNMKTAKALGLTIPPSILDRADEVIA
ncbi:MAG: ABC transporter substrate-binding protein [Alphaproteobacteria bacterium]|nr:MAG: ABC transporter substrate-binding protein [Alphaproteobacteria bacterium]